MTNIQHNNRPDEISIKKLVVNSIALVKVILSKWYIVLLLVIAFGAYRYQKVSKIVPTYPARVKLHIKPQNMVEENEILLQSYAQSISSRTMLEKVLLEEIGDEILINNYLQTYFQFNPKGLDQSISSEFRFTNRDYDQFNMEERTVLDKIIEKILTPKADYSDGFISMSADYTLGIVTINISTPSAKLSIDILNSLHAKVEQMMTQNTSFPFKKAYDILKEESDSLSTSYQNTYYDLNISKDKRLRLLKRDSVVNTEVKFLEKRIHALEVEADVLKMQYLASLEQLKAAQVELNQEALLINVLEKPRKPIKAYQPSAVVEALKWAITGGILAVFLIAAWQITMNVKEELAPCPNVVRYEDFTKIL